VLIGGAACTLVFAQMGIEALATGVQIVINPGPLPLFGHASGLLLAAILGKELDINLVKTCAVAGARLVKQGGHQDRYGANWSTVPGRPPIAYDIVSVDVGVTSVMPDLPGLPIVRSAK
jgi:selenide,water dikinase